MDAAQKSRYIYAAKLGVLFGTIITLLLVALTSLWLNRVLFDTDQFTATGTNALLEQSSRDSIGQLVTDRALENRPQLKSFVGEPLSGAISSFLATEQAEKAVERAIREGQLLFTSPQKPPVILDLTPYKQIITTAQELAPSDREKRINVEDIPDSVVLVDTTKLPNYHQFLVYTHVAGPLALVAAITLAGVWIWRGRANRSRRSQAVLLAVTAAGIIALIIGPVVEPVFISIGRDASSQTLLRNLYDAFITPFRNQALLLAASAAVFLAVLTAVHELKRRYKVELKVSKKTPRSS